jgi:hypothetical protein
VPFLSEPNVFENARVITKPLSHYLGTRGGYRFLSTDMTRHSQTLRLHDKVQLCLTMPILINQVRNDLSVINDPDTK